MSRSKKSALTLAAEQEILAQQSSDIPEDTEIETALAPENTEVFPGLVEPDVKEDEVKLSDLLTAIATDEGNLKYALKQDIGELKAGLVAIVASSTQLGTRFTPTKWVGATDVYDPITKRAISNLPVAYAKEGNEENTVKYLAATMSKIIQMATGEFVFVKPV
jgi:cytoskeletal protein RodZ